jgi:hypothetical protein
MAPLLKDAVLDENFKFHDLRHTYATLLLLAGVNVKIVQERLGHSTITMTLDTYSHLMPGMQDIAQTHCREYSLARKVSRLHPNPKRKKVKSSDLTFLSFRALEPFFQGLTQGAITQKYPIKRSKTEKHQNAD